MKTQDPDSEAFRCPGCEVPTRGGRYCWRCQEEKPNSRRDDYDEGGEA